MPKLIITGSKEYVTRLKNHLHKEHPSTRHRTKLKEMIKRRRR